MEMKSPYSGLYRDYTGIIWGYVRVIWRCTTPIMESEMENEMG